MQLAVYVQDLKRFRTGGDAVFFVPLRDNFGVFCNRAGRDITSVVDVRYFDRTPTVGEQ